MRDVQRILLLSITGLGVLALPGDALAAGLNLNPDMTLVLLNLVVFTVLIFPVNKLLIQPLLNVIQEREERSGGTLDQAGELRADAELAQTELNDGIASMRVDAQARRATILGDADEKERSIIEQARQQANDSVEEVRRTISAELTEARTTLETDARSLASEAAAKILGRAL